MLMMDKAYLSKQVRAHRFVSAALQLLLRACMCACV